MADKEQLHILKQGAETWNEWRQHAGAGTRINLIGADLSLVTLRIANRFGAKLSEDNFREANLSGANLSDANLTGANFSEANFRQADLSEANLSEANLSSADLSEANLSEADLTVANLSAAHLRGANLSSANLREADLSEAYFMETILSNVDLSRCKNLDSIRHAGPSPIDIRTLQRSGRLPLVFLRGVGLPDTLIEYLPSLLQQAIQHYSCFISHSSKDDEFARRLHADLQNNGVRCWFAPEDMKIGAKILDTLDAAIRLRDKVLLVLSEASIAADWVEFEVKKAFAEERQRGTTVLFPVRLDDAVFKTKEAWAVMLRDDRNIGDFHAWKDHDAYQQTLERLLRDLRVDAT
jgi:uncharacterized protein YjbI with pentapeptide repeats